MDVVDNNDFLFLYLVVETIFRFYMDVVDNNDFLDVFMYLIVGNNICILHGCCG